MCIFENFLEKIETLVAIYKIGGADSNAQRHYNRLDMSCWVPGQVNTNGKEKILLWLIIKINK